MGDPHHKSLTPTTLGLKSPVDYLISEEAMSKKIATYTGH